MTWQNLFMPVLLGLMALLLTIFYRLSISRSTALFLGAYLALFALQWLKFGSFHPKHLVLYPLNFWVAYTLMQWMRERFFLHLEYIVTKLALLSTTIWLADIATGGAIRNLLSGYTVGEPYNPIIDSYVLVQTFINEGVESIVPRNSGFAWEPGAFAVICSVALMLNLLRTNFQITGNVGAAILTVALMSSQSTTGYTIFVVIIATKILRDMRGVGRFVAPVALAMLIAGTLTIPFMRDKIVDLWNEDYTELVQSARAEWNADNPLAAQRFLSFKLDFSDFLDNPLTGYGGRDSEAEVQRDSLNIVSISGIGKVMARFGIFGTTFFAIATILSSIQVSRIYQTRTPMLLAIIIAVISISYSLIEHPLFLCLWAYHFLAPPSEKNSTLRYQTA